MKYLWLLLLALQPAFAQVDSLVDLFPLQEGNRWTYSWYDDTQTDARLFSHKGTIDYVVVDKYVTADSIRWVIFARRNLARFEPGPRWVSAVDSLSFGLIEQLDGGGHHLYYGEDAQLDPLAFAFLRSFPLWSRNVLVDSAKLYRYGLVDSTGSEVRDFSSNGGSYHYRFRPNIGLDSIVSGGMTVSGIYWSWRASLLDAYFPPTRVPACIPSRKSLFVIAALGVSFDSVVTLSNPGTATLRISNIRFTNRRVTAYVEDSLVAATSAGRLHIRYSTSATLRDSALVIISSNAPSSPDTVRIIVDTRALTVASFGEATGPQTVLRGEIAWYPFSIQNVGTALPLVFDSITVDNRNFSLIQRTNTVSPGATIIDSVKLNPIDFSELNNQLTLAHIVFYSNSMTSPDTVVVQAWVWGAAARFSPASLDFGIVPYSASKESSFTVTSVGATPLADGTFRSLNSDFVVIDSLVGWGKSPLWPNDHVSIRVRYTPSSSTPTRAIVLFTYFETRTPPDTLFLTGGLVPGLPRLTSSSVEVNFGCLIVGSSAESTLVIYNGGLAVAQGLSVEASDPQFSVSGDLGDLAANASRPVSVRFSPMKRGAFSGTLSVMCTALSQPLVLRVSGSAVDQFALMENYPNPFNAQTTIGFDVASPTLVQLKVFDMLGRDVGTLVNEQLNPGLYKRVFDGSRLSSGVYFYRLQAGSFVQTRKMLLIK